MIARSVCYSAFTIGKLSQQQVERIRQLVSHNAYSQEDIARRFGISKSVVSNIKLRKAPYQ